MSMYGVVNAGEFEKPTRASSINLRVAAFPCGRQVTMNGHRVVPSSVEPAYVVKVIDPQLTMSAPLSSGAMSRFA
jgi:hypothetical protein